MNKILKLGERKLTFCELPSKMVERHMLISLLVSSISNDDLLGVVDACKWEDHQEKGGFLSAVNDLRSPGTLEHEHLVESKNIVVSKISAYPKALRALLPPRTMDVHNLV